MFLTSRHRSIAFGVAVFVAALVVGAAAATTARSTAKPVLTIGLATGPATLDPSKDAASNWQIVRSLTNEALIHLNANGTLSPGLATSWRFYGTGRGPNKDFELTLRHNARFSDGTPVTAAAVKAWLEYFPQGNGPYSGLLGPVQSIDTAGQWTVRIHLKTPNPQVPWLFADVLNWGFVASPKAIADPSSFGTQTNGAGQYMVDPSNTVSGGHYTLVPNPYYYDKSKIKYSKVVVSIIPNATSLLQAAVTHQVDVAQGDASTADQAADSRAVAARGAPFTWLGLNLLDRHVKPLSDVRVRQALNYAIDRKAIAKALGGRWASPTSSAMAPDALFPHYASYYPYNPAKARSLLAAAGYPNGFTMKVMSASLFGSFGDPLIQAMAKYLGQVGVTLSITSAATTSQYLTQRYSGQFAAIEYGVGSYIPFWFLYNVAIKPTASGNPNHVDEPVANRLYLQALRAAKPGTYFQKLAEQETATARFIPVLATSNIWYLSKNVGGVNITVSRPLPFASEWFPK